MVALEYRPWMRQRIVNRRNFIVKDVRILLVDEKAFSDDGVVVLVERNPGRIEHARASEVARLDTQLIVAPVAVGIVPRADRIAHEGRFGLLWHRTAVGINTTLLHQIFDEDVS